MTPWDQEKIWGMGFALRYKRDLALWILRCRKCNAQLPMPESEVLGAARAHKRSHQK